WLGTDDQGRDVVARLIYGFRISVLFGLTLTIFSSIIGIAAGGFQGYFGGWTDLIFQRFIEIWSAIPSLYLLLILSSVLVPGFVVVRRAAVTGQGQCAGAMARLHRLLLGRDHAVAPDLHRRGRARRVRPAQDVQIGIGHGRYQPAAARCP